MHIPDGYLSPATCGVMYAAAVPFWAVAVKRVRKELTARTVPVLALFSAFSFTLMMFNVPIPGGTTAHAVGATLLAIVLGPWEAVLGVSTALGIQALFFGDGGLLTFGANCFNMAIVMPLVGYFIYKVISSDSDALSPRRTVGAVIGSYLGIVTAAACAGIELGLQPVLFHSANGTPLYAPYTIGVSLPAMFVRSLVGRRSGGSRGHGWSRCLFTADSLQPHQSRCCKKERRETLAGLGCARISCSGYPYRTAGIRYGLGRMGRERVKNDRAWLYSSRITETRRLVACPDAGLRPAAHGGGHRLHPIGFYRDYFYRNSNLVARTLAQP